MSGSCRYCGKSGTVFPFWNGGICLTCAQDSQVTYDDSVPGEFRLALVGPRRHTPIISYVVADLPLELVGQIARLETVRLRHRLERIVTEQVPRSASAGPEARPS